jgi:hypothetical protein
MAHKEQELNIVEAKKIIQERGYFEFIFEPAIYNEKLLCKEDSNCGAKVKSILDRTQVQLRGWYYPHINKASKSHQDAPYVVDNGVEQWIIWEMHREVWKMFFSGQFVHRFALIEDWLKESGWYKNADIKPGEVLDVIGVIYRFVEITQFTKNLYEEGFLDCDGGKITISLFNTKNRSLQIVFDKARAGLLNEYKTRIDPVRVEKIFSKKEILENAEDISIQLCTEFFSFFNWDNQPLQVFRDEQKKFLSRQI